MSVTTRPSSFWVRASEATQARGSFSAWENFLPRLPTAEFQDELKSILKNSRGELPYAELLHLGRRLQNRDQSEPAVELFMQLAGSGEIPAEIRFQALKQVELLQGKGNFGTRAELLLKRFREESTDLKIILPMMGARVLGEISKAWGLARLAGKPSSLWTRGAGAKWAAGTLGFGIEGAVFAGVSRNLSPSSAQPFGEDLAKSYLALGTLRLFGAVGGGGYAAKWLGLTAVHRLESSLGLRPEADISTLLTDSLGTLLSLEVGSHLGARFLGKRFFTFQGELKIRVETPFPSSRGAFLESYPDFPQRAKALAISPKNQLTKIHIQAPEPMTEAKGLSLMAVRDESGGNPRLANLPDTAMGQLFTGVKPSRAVPLIANSPEQISQKLPLAFFRRPSGQNPRTIILELRPGSGLDINAEFLNRLTSLQGKEFPDRTPFEILHVGGHRTFSGKVANYRLHWQEAQDASWGRAKLQSAATEFEVESAKEFYLILENLRRQSEHSKRTSFVAKFLEKPYVFETSLSNFIQRALNFFQVPGKSFRVDFSDAEPPLDFHLTDTIWLAADRVSELPAPPPSAGVSPVPSLAEAIVGKTPLISPYARVSANDPPLLLITSAQGLREIPARFFLRKAPRRIEAWYEPPISANAEREHWKLIFKDIPPGTVLTIHESRTKKTHTIQRREDDVHLRSAEWKPVIGWHQGIQLSVRDLGHLLRQLQFLLEERDTSETLAVSVREPWMPKEVGLLANLINGWENLPYREIEVRSSDKPDLSFRLRRNHLGQFIAEDLRPLRTFRK